MNRDLDAILTITAPRDKCPIIGSAFSVWRTVLRSTSDDSSDESLLRSGSDILWIHVITVCTVCLLQVILPVQADSCSLNFFCCPSTREKPTECSCCNDVFCAHYICISRTHCIVVPRSSGLHSGQCCADYPRIRTTAEKLRCVGNMQNHHSVLKQSSLKRKLCT